MRKQSFVFLLMFLSSYGLSLQAIDENISIDAKQNPSHVVDQRVKQIEDRKGTINDAERKDAIMKRDDIDQTDAYAIPFDSSEVEDEEEINRLNENKTFKIFDR